MMKVSALWNGGWDEYEVDTTDVIDDPAKLEDYSPTVEIGNVTYLRTLFCGKLRNEFSGKAVKVIRHIRGGD